MRFFFLIFYHFFFAIFFPRPIMNGNRDKFFFPSFLAYFIPFWLKIMSERDFLIFWIFLLLFSKFSSPSRAWTKFGTKTFFSPSRLISFPFSLEIMPEWGFLIFLLFFKEFSCPARVGMEFGTTIFFSLYQAISFCFC